MAMQVMNTAEAGEAAAQVTQARTNGQPQPGRAGIIIVCPALIRRQTKSLFTRRFRRIAAGFSGRSGRPAPCHG
jgi:hypothetical protein